MKYFVLLALAVLVSCGSSKESELQRVKDEVITLHDEVMPLSGPLYDLRMSLQKKMSTDTTGSKTLGTEEVITQIKNAEDAMMDWMRNYDPTFEGVDDIETHQYLLEQRKAIEEVAAQMKEAKKKGEEFLIKY